MKWRIWKNGPREWRAVRGAGLIMKCRSHAEAISYVNSVVAANRYAAMAA